MFAIGVRNISKVYVAYDTAARCNLLGVHGITSGTTVIGPTLNRAFKNKPTKTAATDSIFSTLQTLNKKLFGKYLLFTNVIGSGTLMFLGDIAAQDITYRHGPPEDVYIEWDRAFRMFIVGVVVAPINHYMYLWLDRKIPIPTWPNIMKKILFDQFIISPIFLTAFFHVACFLEGQSLSETKEELLGKFLAIYAMEWMVWPWVQIVNFRFIRPRYRVTYVNVTQGIYNIFMSYIKNDVD